MKRDQIFLTTMQKFDLKALVSAMIAVLFFSPLAMAEIGDGLILCKIQKNVRTLRIEKGEDAKCRAIYTKQGVDSEIGSGMNFASCEEYVAGVRKTLEEAHWNCREIKEARSSALILDAAE